MLEDFPPRESNYFLRYFLIVDYVVYKKKQATGKNQQWVNSVGGTALQAQSEPLVVWGCVVVAFTLPEWHHRGEGFNTEGLNLGAHKTEAIFFISDTTSHPHWDIE